MRKTEIGIILLLFSTGCRDLDSGMDIAVPAQPENLIVKAEFAETKAFATSFEGNDSVGIYVVKSSSGVEAPLKKDGNYVDNALFIYTAGVLKTDRAVYYPLDREDLQVYAYHPYISGSLSTDNLSFVVPADQREEADFKAADFVWAKQSAIYTDMNDISLTFSHSMSHLSLRLVAGEGVTSLEGADITIGYVRNEARINLGSGGARVESGAPIVEMIPRRLSDESYEMLLPPQHVEEGRKMIRVSLNGKVFSWVSPAGGYMFTAGETSAFTLTLTDNE